MSKHKKQRASIGLSCSALIIAFLVVLAQPAAAQGDPSTNGDALEEYAYSIGLQAYLYGYPLVITEVSREAMLTTSGRPGVPPMAINKFYHFSHLVTPAVKSAVSANVDTLFSTAWLDLSGGPVILHVPDTADCAFVHISTSTHKRAIGIITSYHNWRFCPP